MNYCSFCLSPIAENTVTENVEGRTLSSVVAANRRFAPEVTVALLLPVIESLKKVHAQGLIHCAISPDNIMVTQDKVKLVNFDAARATTAMDNDSLSIILKAGYSPEEKYRSKGKQGPWTDVYALCATLYKCITGRTPDDSIQRFYGDTTIKPRKLGVKIDRKLEAAIMKGMAVHRQDRFQSVDELLEALKNAQKPANKHGFRS